MKGGRKSERLKEREIGKERIEVDGGGDGQIGWVWGWSGVGWWLVAARLAIGGGGQCVGEPGGARPAVGCQDRSSLVHGWRSERWIGDEGGWAEIWVDWCLWVLGVWLARDLSNGPT